MQVFSNPKMESTGRRITVEDFLEQMETNKIIKIFTTKMKFLSVCSNK